MDYLRKEVTERDDEVTNMDEQDHEAQQQKYRSTASIDFDEAGLEEPKHDYDPSERMRAVGESLDIEGLMQSHQSPAWGPTWGPNSEASDSYDPSHSFGTFNLDHFDGPMKGGGKSVSMPEGLDALGMGQRTGHADEEEDLDAAMGMSNLSMESFGGETAKKATSWGALSLDDFAIADPMAISGASGTSETQARRPLKAIPAYYEKYTSFYSRFPAAELLEEVDRSLQSCPCVDYDYIIAKNKFKGVVRACNQEEKYWFNIKVYRGNSNDEVLLEVQKRGGCSLGFTNFYLRLVSKLAPFICRRGTVTRGEDPDLNNWIESACAKSSQLCDAFANVKKAKSSDDFDFSIPPAPASLSREATSSSSADDAEEDELLIAQVVSLISMLKTNNSGETLDSKRQAMGSLAAVSAVSADVVLNVLRDEATMSACGNDLVEALRSGIISDDMVLCDDACTLLRNLSKEKEFRDDIVANLLSGMFVKLEEPCSTDGWFARRQIIQSLAMLSSSHSDEIVRAPEAGKYVETLRQLHSHVQGLDEAKSAATKNNSAVTSALLLKQQNNQAFQQYQQHLYSTLQQIGAM